MKCDKRHPCTNCTKAGIECIFPGPGRAPRRSRKPPDTELLARLRRLEGVIQTLGKDVNEEHETSTDGPAALESPQQTPTQITAEDPENTNCQKMLSMHEPSKAEQSTSRLTNDFGKLVVDKRRSRYVSSTFWTSLSEEVAELGDILDDETEEEGDQPSPGSSESVPSNNQGFLFSFSSTMLSLREFHPSVNQIGAYWEIYKANIDPVMKLLNARHVEMVLYKNIADLDHIQKPLEAFLFSMYFAVVTTLSDEECLAQLGIERQAALRK